MRRFVVLLAACGASAKPVEPPAADPCAAAFADYEQHWRVARAGELVEVGMDAQTTADIVAIEIATLPNRDELAKLRRIYVAVAVFLPDAPWPRALDAADLAITACGEAARKP